MITRSIPFAKPSITEEEVDEVVKCMKSNWLTTGKKTIEFEEMFKRYIGADYALAVSSCTAALHLSLKVNDIGNGDEVITTPLTFVSTINVIEICGAKPVLVDIERDSMTIDSSKIEKAITEKTKAIIAVHYGGNACDMDSINDIAKRHNLVVIEDAAHGLGTEYKGNKIGNTGNLVCFSFYPTKNMTTCEGGMITTNSPELINRLSRMRLHGLTKDAWKRYSNEGSWKYDVEMPGFKYNMPDIFSAIGIHQLKKLDTFNKKRNEIIEYYRKGLGQYKDDISMQITDEKVKHSGFLFPIVLKTVQRDTIMERLKEKGINTSVLFIPIYEFTYYRNKYDFCLDDLTVCYDISKKLLCLPLYYDMSLEDAEYVVETLICCIQNEKKSLISRDLR